MVTRSQKYGCQKTRSSESEPRARVVLGKLVMRDWQMRVSLQGRKEPSGAELLTRYRSEETLTRMRSSPTRTFSPSDLCFEAGCIVHQQASPKSHVTIRIMVSHNALHQGSHSHQTFQTQESINPHLVFLYRMCPSPCPDPLHHSPCSWLQSGLMPTSRVLQIFCPLMWDSRHTPCPQPLHLLRLPVIPRQRPTCQSWIGRW